MGDQRALVEFKVTRDNQEIDLGRDHKVSPAKTVQLDHQDHQDYRGNQEAVSRHHGLAGTLEKEDLRDQMRAPVTVKSQRNQPSQLIPSTELIGTTQVTRSPNLLLISWRNCIASSVKEWIR